MKRIAYYTADGLTVLRAEFVFSIFTEPSRTRILQTMKNINASYIETNVRRYYADDIYARRKGQAI